MNVAEVVAQYRKAESSRRRLDGHTQGTARARRRHEAAVDHADSALRDAGHHSLRKLLAEEAALLDRMAANHEEQPELRSRVRVLRRQVADLTRG